jgi:hypothetical protein
MRIARRRMGARAAMNPNRRRETLARQLDPADEDLTPEKNFENCDGIFNFLCYIRGLSNGSEVFPAREMRELRFDSTC